jgi:chromosomal replication initiator protein
MTCPPQVEPATSACGSTSAVWAAVFARLREELPSLAFEAWIEPIVDQLAPDGLCLACPNAFHLERVRERYLARIERYAAEANDGPVAIKLRIGQPADATLPTSAPIPRAAIRAEPPCARVVALPARGSDVPASSESDLPPHDFTSFVVGPGNALAREACAALARGHQLAVSPLYVVAGSGLGKTHLAASVAREARTRGERVLYVSAEQFTNELMTGIRTQRTEEMKRRYREQCDVLVFEDVQFLRGKRQTQFELLHTLEHLARRGARILLTSEQLPREIPDLDPRLCSRLASGLCAEIEPPDAELRRSILCTRARAAGVTLPGACIDRLVDAVEGNIRDLESALVQVLATASLLRRPIDSRLVETALRKLQPRHRSGRLSPDRIAEIVASRFHLTPAALASRSRRREVLLPRQIAMVLCMQHTDASVEQIGRIFGRSHPAVTNAARALEVALSARPALREPLAEIRAEIEALSGSRKGPHRADR